MTLDAPYRVRPIDAWPGAATYPRRRPRFSGTWMDTRRTLARELRHLDATDIVMQMAVEEHEIRLDGQPRASAKPQHPGIILSFRSKHGPLKYACDTFLDWRQNVRAIALGLARLRAVDEYGITKRGEQYTGWKALPPAGGTMSRADAWEYLVAIAGADLTDSITHVVHAALRVAHPDHGGNIDIFERVQAARRMVEAT